MRELKYYGLNDFLDFGENKGELVSKVLHENRNRISFYFKEVEWFLMSDDLLQAYAGKFADVMLPKEGSLTGTAMLYKDFLPLWNKKKIEKFKEKYPDMLKNKRGLWMPGDKYRYDRKELDELNRDAFSDGDGTQYWSFMEE